MGKGRREDKRRQHTDYHDDEPVPPHERRNRLVLRVRHRSVRAAAVILGRCTPQVQCAAPPLEHKRAVDDERAYRPIELAHRQTEPPVAVAAAAIAAVNASTDHKPVVMFDAAERS